MSILQKLQQDRIFYISALLFAFILPLSRAAISFFILWFIVLFIARRDYRTSWELLKTNRAFVAMGAFIAFMFISTLWSSDIHTGLKQMRLYSYWIIIPILAVTLKKEWLPTIISAFLGGMFVSEILAYGIFFDLWSINGRTPDYPSPFMSHIHYSLFLATTSIILLSRILSNRYHWKIKLLMLIFFLTATGNLMFSTGRTGQLAFFIALGVAIIIHYRLTLKSFLLFISFSFAIFTLAYSTFDLFSKRIDSGMQDIRNIQANNFSNSFGERAAFWIITKDILQEHPLIGAGIGDYKHAAAEALEKNNHGFSPYVIKWCKSTHFHNQYLMILAQGGLIGFILMLWLLTELFRLKIQDKEVKEFSLLGLSVFTVGCIAEPLWILQFPIILFVFISAVSLASALSSQRMEK
ncbi:O-antigen ligase family protein [Sulfuricurvum sp.]|uniref:O-antigen ligase family protein n=1 Tax=Sulfuricurvum sp. TaxID=2025608 RepID=UPI003BAF81D1